MNVELNDGKRRLIVPENVANDLRESGWVVKDTYPNERGMSQFWVRPDRRALTVDNEFWYAVAQTLLDVEWE